MELIEKIKENPEKILKELDKARTELEVSIRTQQNVLNSLEESIKNDPDVNNDILDILAKIKETNLVEELDNLKLKCEEMEKEVAKDIEDTINNSRYLKEILEKVQ